MGIKTDWHEDAVEEGSAGVDPFDLASSPVMTSTMPITLDTSAPELNDLLVRLHRREERLFNAGVSCDLKWDAEATCLSCPFNKANDPDSSLGVLCSIGCEQERTQTMLAAKRSRGL